MLQTFRNRNFLIMLMGDICLMAASYFLAYYLRFDWDIPAGELANFQKTVIWIVLVKLLCFYFFGLYKGMWRYTGIEDLRNLIKAVITSSAMIVLILFITVRLAGFPRSIFPIDFVLTLLTTGAMRVCIRLYFQREKGERHVSFFGRNNNNNKEHDKKHILVVGAGGAGEKTVRELMENPTLPYRAVGIIDDDRQKKGRSIHGVPILGQIDSLAEIVNERKVEEILIAVPSATGKEMRRIVGACESCGVGFKTLPSIGELIDGKVSIKDLRDVQYEDLLGRSTVKLDIQGIQGYLKDTCVLVTGAGGSIGSELCRQIVRFNPATVILMDVSETNLYSIQMELEHRVGYLRYVPVLGKVQDHDLLERVLRRYDPQVVFHAAAYKHVPMLEANPWEAVLNNIMGTRVVMEQTQMHGADRFVLISTDKAIRPTNVMGASKRVCEMLLQSQTNHDTLFMGVRFGNVTGSSGSVIPLFRDQIARGGAQSAERRAQRAERMAESAERIEHGAWQRTQSGKRIGHSDKKGLEDGEI